MTRIESIDPEPQPGLTTEIKRFWSLNVNAERLMGRQMSAHARGQTAYFADLERQRYRSHRHLLPWLESMSPGKSALEVGCGIGLDSFKLAKRGVQVTAMDLTELGVKTACGRFREENVDGRFLAGNAGELPFGDESFDYVYSFGVLHHAADTQQTIHEVHRVLRRGGEAKIMLYNRHSINEMVHRITGVPFEEKHQLCPVVRRFTRTEIQQLFAGFSQVRSHLEYAFGEGYGRVFELIPDSVYRFISRRWGWHLMISAIK